LKLGRFVLLLLTATGACKAPPSLEQLRDTGYIGLRQGRLDAARAAASEGVRRSKDAEWTRTFRLLEAEVLLAERHIQEALALIERSGPYPTAGPLGVRALSTRGIARCYLRTPDDFARAEADLVEASRLAARVGSDELAGEVALRRGTCRAIQDDPLTAEALFRSALAIAERRGLTALEAQAAGSMGNLRANTAHYDDAVRWIQRAIRAARDSPVVLTKSLINLGWCYTKLGDTERAVTLLRKGEAQAYTAGLTGDQLIALAQLGNAHHLAEDLDRAEEYFRRALELARTLKDKTTSAELLSNLADVALDQGHVEQAARDSRQALQIKEELGNEPARQYSLLDEGRIAIVRGAFEEAETIYRTVLDSPDANAEILCDAWSNLGTVYAKAGRAADAERAFARASEIIEASRQAVRIPENRISFFAGLRQFHESHVEFLTGTGRLEQALDVADRGRARLLQERLRGERLPRATRAAGYRQTARRLDAVLLAYWVSRARSYLWVVTGDAVELHRLPGERALRDAVARHQAHVLRSRDPLDDQTAEAEWLYRTLVEPALPRIRAGARVVVLPDGPLHQLNFETLVVPGPRRHYWIEDVTLAIAPSIGLIDDPVARRDPKTATLLAIGDPISPDADFPALPYAEREVAHIASAFAPERRTVYTGAAARPSAYRSANPAQYTYIHFAAHVTASRESPLDSAVILSADGEAYKLYAHDVVHVPLGADLVTLSACRSAGSRTYAGEGLVGLAWAFLSSGAGNVIGGLWNVEDTSTSELMEHVYLGLARGLDPARALREAKLRLLRSDSAYRKPYYWAPFVIYTRRPVTPS
jgi:CHAT domain-containing protein